MVWKLVETYPEINQLNIEFRLELLKCHFAANSQQGRVINWLRVLQISKEILAIDEFNVNACVSLNFGVQSIFKGRRVLNPYWQILENSSRSFSEISVFQGKTQTDLCKTHPVFFSKFQFLMS